MVLNESIPERTQVCVYILWERLGPKLILPFIVIDIEALGSFIFLLYVYFARIIFLWNSQFRILWAFARAVRDA